MGWFSSAVSFVSSVASGICSAVSSIGSALSSFVGSVAPVLSGLITALQPVAEAIGKFANSFLQNLGILQPGEKVEHLGERALQAAQSGIVIDKFDNFSGYMEALRKFDLDPDVAAKRSPAEKLVAGLGVGTVAVEDKFNAERGSLNGLWLLPIANPGYFTPDRMQSLVATGRLGGDVYAYLEQRLSGHESRSFEHKLESSPDGARLSAAAVSQLHSALDSARTQWADLAKQVQQPNQNAPGA